METCCGYGYDRPPRYTLPSPGFSRHSRSASDTARAAVLYGPIVAGLSPYETIPGRHGPYKEKTTLPEASNGVSRVGRVTPSPARAPEDARRGYRSDGCGMLTAFPFASRGRVRPARVARCPFGTPLGYSLGSTDPCSTAVHMEPFSTSVFKVLV